MTQRENFDYGDEFEFVWTVDVTTTDTRPIVPAQYTSRVQVLAATAADAHLISAHMAHRPAFTVTDNPENGTAHHVTGVFRPAVEMTTSTTIFSVVM